MIDPEFVRLLNLLKVRYPSSTLSLDRTPQHNASPFVKGAKGSWHLSTKPGGAKAADLIFDDNRDLLPATKYAKALGFTGIECDFRNHHLHVDTRDTEPWHVVCTTEGTVYLDKYLTNNPELI